MTCSVAGPGCGKPNHAADGAVAAADAARCMQPVWGFYHGAVLLSLYSDILIVTLILFFLLWPYFRWFV